MVGDDERKAGMVVGGRKGGKDGAEETSGEGRWREMEAAIERDRERLGFVR
ncbi:hypothetical protein Sjap_022437 [Stephania japonica]|uniref:Uncharacterized protein n=1 Tax=Stephania japonica TaxID=461633 RepID=A0AAP0ENW2_9MAGN